MSKINISNNRVLVSLAIMVLTTALPCSSILAQVTVQLPQTRTFQTNSSFFVPDGGTLFLGGVSRGSEGLNSRGLGGSVPFLRPLFNNRAYGRSTTSSGISTSVQIISLKEMERQLMLGSNDQFSRSFIPYRNPETGNPITSYSWAKRYSLEGSGSSKTASPSNKRKYKLGTVSRETILPSSGRSAFASRTGNRLNNKSSVNSLQSKLGSANQEGQLPTNEEIRSRAKFLKQFIGRKK